MQIRYKAEGELADLIRASGYAIGDLVGFGGEVAAYAGLTPDGRTCCIKIQHRPLEWCSEWGTRPFDNPRLDHWATAGQHAYAQRLTERPLEWAESCRFAEHISRHGYRVVDWYGAQGGVISGRMVLNDYGCAERRVIPEAPRPEDRRVYCEILVKTRPLTTV